MKLRFLILCMLFSLCASAQFGRSSRGGRKSSHWPFFGSDIPPYISVIGGYEGLKTTNFQAGIGINLFRVVVDPPIGGMGGPIAIYKQSFSTQKIYSYEFEFGVYAGFILAVNYNLNYTSSGLIKGTKPMIGISIYNLQMIYGYSFYKDSKDLKRELRHNRIGLRYVIPFVRLSRK
jgi:hypothetical protein